MTAATHNEHTPTTERVLFLACALREKTWQLGLPTGHGQKPRERAVAARELARVLQEIAQATKRCGLPETAPVVRCDEAGREGCWRQRFLHAPGVTNSVVDASAIAGKRRPRRATSDALAVRQLVRLLMRDAPGDRDVWRVVPVPSVAAADGRHLPRDLETLKRNAPVRRLASRASSVARGDAWRACPGCLNTSRRCGGGLARLCRMVGAAVCCGGGGISSFCMNRLPREKRSGVPCCTPHQPPQVSRGVS